MSDSGRVARVVLFDIDQTLLYTGGAGSKAMDIAFEEMFGIANGFSGVEFSGRTDIAIFRDGLRIHAIDGDFSALLERFKEVYAGHLVKTLAQSQGSLLPGIAPLLEALSGRDDVLLGLSTGNFRHGAELKLRRYGIFDHFLDGGFADDAEDRAEIVRVAARRVGETDGRHRAVVIGDTPYDIASARANDFLALGVATGNYSADDLRGAGADVVLPSFADWREASVYLAEG